uniref:Uncharacterized protein n=1 Tax=Dulem virus 211 TaxID=3145688 RepID=A0AAU8B256_9VIRU
MIAKGNVFVTANVIEDKIEKEIERKVDKILHETISDAYKNFNFDENKIEYNFSITITTK